MKAQLNFDLDDPEDKMAHMRCVKATDMALVLWELSYNTKKKIEWEMESNPGEDVIEKVYEKFHELLEEHNINIEELIN